MRRVAGEIPDLIVPGARFELRDERIVQRSVSLVFCRVRAVLDRQGAVVGSDR